MCSQNLGTKVCSLCLLVRLQTWRAIIFSRVCLSVCLSLCLWPALLPFSVDRFWWNLVTRTLRWSSLAATIVVQIGHGGTTRCLFENLKKFSKVTEFEFQNSGPSFFASVSPVYCKKKSGSIRTKLTEEIDFEVCPYGDSGNGTAAAARPRWDILIEPAARRHAAIEARRHSELGACDNWGRNRAVKTYRLVAMLSTVCLCISCM